MRVLVAANERAMGPNIVDMRGIAMDRLEARLDRLEDTHRSVIAAAYDNVAGHRADPPRGAADAGAAALRDLPARPRRRRAAILRVDSLRLVIEADRADGEDGIERLDGVLVIEPRGFVDAYLRGGRGGAAARVALRPLGDARSIGAGHPLRGLPAARPRRGRRGCWCWARGTRSTSRPSRGPTSSPSSAPSSERALRRFLG